MSQEDVLREILGMPPRPRAEPKFYEDYWHAASGEARSMMLPPNKWPGAEPPPDIADYPCIEHRMPAVGVVMPRQYVPPAPWTPYTDWKFST